MVVHLNDIPDRGLSLDLPLGVAWLRDALAGTPAEAGPADAHVELTLTRSFGNVTVRGTLLGEVTYPCTRCGASSALALNEGVRVTFVPHKNFADRDRTHASNDEGLELTDEDLELATYLDQTLDLEPAVRDQLVLALPMTHLCRADCQGLCGQCGADLNLETCTCVRDDIDPRWRALKGLKPNA